MNCDHSGWKTGPRFPRQSALFNRLLRPTIGLEEVSPHVVLSAREQSAPLPFEPFDMFHSNTEGLNTLGARPRFFSIGTRFLCTSCIAQTLSVPCWSRWDDHWFKTHSLDTSVVSFICVRWCGQFHVSPHFRFNNVVFFKVQFNRIKKNCPRISRCFMHKRCRSLVSHAFEFAHRAWLGVSPAYSTSNITWESVRGNLWIFLMRLFFDDVLFLGVPWLRFVFVRMLPLSCKMPCWGRL